MQVHSAGKCWTRDWNDLCSVPHEIEQKPEDPGPALLIPTLSYPSDYSLTISSSKRPLSPRTYRVFPRPWHLYIWTIFLPFLEYYHNDHNLIFTCGFKIPLICFSLENVCPTRQHIMCSVHRWAPGPSTGPSTWWNPVYCLKESLSRWLTGTWKHVLFGWHEKLRWS